MDSSDAVSVMNVAQVKPAAAEAEKCESLNTEITENVLLESKEDCSEMRCDAEHVLKETMQRSSRETEHSISNIVKIHVTAVLENSPFSKFDKEEKESILRCIAVKEHLRRNIEDVTFCDSSSRMCSGNLYQHIVDVVFMVKTVALWESPRSYVWKHLGQGGWKRGNGTTIQLTRIHQK